MATIFDTHRAVQSLKASGLEEAQAEAMVEMVCNALGEGVATKSDIDRLEQVTKADTDRLEQSTKADTDRLEQSAKADTDRLEQRVDAVDKNLNQRIDALEKNLIQRIDAVEIKATLRFTLIYFAGLGLLFAALRFIS